MSDPAKKHDSGPLGFGALIKLIGGKDKSGVPGGVGIPAPGAPVTLKSGTKVEKKIELEPFKHVDPNLKPPVILWYDSESHGKRRYLIDMLLNGKPIFDYDREKAKVFKSVKTAVAYRLTALLGAYRLSCTSPDDEKKTPVKEFPKPEEAKSATTDPKTQDVQGLVADGQQGAQAKGPSIDPNLQDKGAGQP
jgi:hypothetical protein